MMIIVSIINKYEIKLVVLFVSLQILTHILFYGSTVQSVHVNKTPLATTLGNSRKKYSFYAS